ncbi:MAG: CsgG/HfaB family protein [Dehalococcoidia bacterium]|nr:CsgG/HfaB family protein [Dehalococcoidia bacterium]
MRKLFPLIVVLCFSILLPCTVVADFQKTKVAVLDFQLQGQGYETSDMGKIVAEWFITALVNEGRFDVIERGLLTKILEEQNLIMTGTVDSDIATQLGQILGVKVIISGSVMRFQDIIEINARIIDVESASIISAESIKGSSTTELRELVIKVSEKIIKNFPLEGYIVYVGVDCISIDLGKAVGVKRGMGFIVYKEGNVIKHPKTGQILDVEKIETGIIEIISVNEKIAKAHIVIEKFPGAIEYGQRVKSSAEASIHTMIQPSAGIKSK